MPPRRARSTSTKSATPASDRRPSPRSLERFVDVVCRREQRVEIDSIGRQTAPRRTRSSNVTELANRQGIEVRIGADALFALTAVLEEVVEVFEQNAGDAVSGRRSDRRRAPWPRRTRPRYMST